VSYLTIYSQEDAHALLIIGQTREDHWLDFKSALGKDNAENARDIAQFANASGGVLILGAEENKQVLTGFTLVPDPPSTITRIDDIVKGHLTPVPVFEPRAIEVETGKFIVAINIPPSLPLVARHEKHERFEFITRGHESK